jgi:hypothetical protein
MFGIYFSEKRDRRALFLVPFLFWAPLQPAFPVDGVVELRLDPWAQQLFAACVVFGA